MPEDDVTKALRDRLRRKEEAAAELKQPRRGLFGRRGAGEQAPEVAGAGEGRTGRPPSTRPPAATTPEAEYTETFPAAPPPRPLATTAADDPVLAEPAAPARGSIEATASATHRSEAEQVVWAITILATALALVSWFLPWFAPEGQGVGTSPQDVITAPLLASTGLVAVVGLALVAQLAGLAADLVAARRRRPAFHRARLRAGLSLAGAAATLGIVAVHRTGGALPFPGPTAGTIAHNAVWMTLTACLLSAYALGLHQWILRHSGVAFALVAATVGILFPFIFAEPGNFINWAAGLAGVYIMLSLGLNVVVGQAGLLDLGYAAFFAIGAYTTASLSSSYHNTSAVFALPGEHGIHLPFAILLFLGAAVAAMFGGILGAPTLRLRGDYLAIVTLGFGEIVPDLATNNVFGLTGGPNGIGGVDQPAFPTHTNAIWQFDIFGVSPKPYYYATLVLITIVILALRNIERSRLGRAWIAIREDEVAAAATGINTVTTKLLAFAIGASVSGFAGAFFGAELGTVSPVNFQFQVSVTALSTVVLGGIGNITGSIVGGLLISFLIFWVLPNAQSWLSTLSANPHIQDIGNGGVSSALSNFDFSKWNYVVYGVILVGIMLLRPAGLLPSRARRVELAGTTEPEALVAVEGKA